MIKRTCVQFPSYDQDDQDMHDQLQLHFWLSLILLLKKYMKVIIKMKFKKGNKVDLVQCGSETDESSLEAS